MDSFRFKVVKIISKEPFKRGRWLCMDFTDPPTNGTANIEACLSTNRPIDITSSTGQGVSAVAIDNKIEQAMDLVKSHLMFAVREEMDVLKEKINELMEKISSIELENSILKANASQETLALIEQQQHLQQFQNHAAAAQQQAAAAVTAAPQNPQPAVQTAAPSLAAQTSTQVQTSKVSISALPASSPVVPHLPNANPQQSTPAPTSGSPNAQMLSGGPISLEGTIHLQPFVCFSKGFE